MRPPLVCDLFPWHFEGRIREGVLAPTVGAAARTCKPATMARTPVDRVRIGVLSPAALWLWLRSNYGGELMLVGSHVAPLRSVDSIRS